MAVVYRCDTCGATTDNVAGWLVTSVSFIHYDPNWPTTGEPTGRMLDSTLPDFLFDKEACRDEWRVKAGI